MQLFMVSIEIAKKMDSIMAGFLWSSLYQEGKFHLVRCDTMVRPVEQRGWGILDSRNLNRALIIKKMWRVMSSECLWYIIIKEKYMGGQHFFYMDQGKSQGEKWHILYIEKCAKE